MEAFQNIKLKFDCPKKLDELTPCGSAWNCSSCEQMVYDFRGMSEVEILNIFAKSNTLLCGVYDAGRFVIPVAKPKWQRWLSAAMLMLGMSAFSEMVFAQPQPHPTNKNTVNKVTKDTTLQITLGTVAAPSPPRFPGYDVLEKYVHQNLNYKGTFTGTVLVSFVVDRSGWLTNIKVLTPTEKELDKKILAAMQGFPQWEPAAEEEISNYTLVIDFPAKRSNVK